MTIKGNDELMSENMIPKLSPEELKTFKSKLWYLAHPYTTAIPEKIFFLLLKNIK